ELDAREEALQLVGTQRREDDLAERGAVRRAHHADAIGQLERAGPAGAGDHHHGVAHAYREMAALAGLLRQLLEHRRRNIDHLAPVEAARREREQRPADPVALRVLLLADVAERNQRLGEMERGRRVQADPLAQLGEADAVAVARDLLEDAEGTAERLHADALAILGVVVDIGSRCLDQPGDLGPGGRLVGGLGLGSRSHRITSMPRYSNVVGPEYHNTNPHTAL